MTRGEYFADDAVRDRIRRWVAAAKLPPAELGWKGSPGFMGTSTYTASREAGYEGRSGR